jgi:hypothetical protein
MAVTGATFGMTFLQLLLTISQFMFHTLEFALDFGAFSLILLLAVGWLVMRAPPFSLSIGCCFGFLDHDLHFELE